VTGGSTSPFIAYVRRIRAWLHREAYRLCGDWHEAEDLAQVTLCQMYRRWDRLTDHDQLTAYTRQALLRVYLSERRRLRWKREVSHPQPPDNACVEPYRTVEDRVTLATALDQLAPRQRAVITLRFYGDLSIEQTAAILGCSTGTISSQTHLALKRLRTLLDKRRPRAASPGTAPTAE
jgi:RNA polymerase sigma-70 factor (sigma-E family)